MKHSNLTKLIVAGCVAAVFSATAADIDWSQLPAAATNANVTFSDDIMPLFKASCVRCHSGERARAGLQLDSLDGVLKGTKRGPVLTAGDSANSLLVKSISQLDPKTAMPPKPRGPRGGPGGPGGPGGEWGHPPGTNAPPMQPPPGAPGAEGGPGPGGEPPRFGDGDHPPGMPPGMPLGTNAAGMRPRNFGPPMKPLTAEQVGLVRAWIDQGAK